MDTKTRKQIESKLRNDAREVIQKSTGRKVNITGVSFREKQTGAPADTTGPYASVVFRGVGVTQEELEMFEKRGLNHIETATHVSPNPAISDETETIDIDDLSDAAETDIELVFELDEQYSDIR